MQYVEIINAMIPFFKKSVAVRFARQVGLLCIGLTVGPVNYSVADEKYQPKPFVISEQPFSLIENTQLQAEQWAMCSAAYEFMAVVMMDNQPARATQISALAKGSSLAVIMTLLSDDISKDLSPEEFSVLWSRAEVFGTEMPKSSQNALMADLESRTESDTLNFYNDLSATVQVCLGNLEAQQSYIDQWRELAQSGMLDVPDN